MKHPIIIKNNKCHQRNDYSSLIGSFIQASKTIRSVASSVYPLRKTLDYQSIAKKTFLVEQLPDTVQIHYDFPITKKHKCPLKINNRNGKCENHRRVIMPTFEIVNSPKISLQDIKKRRFKLIGR